MCNLTLLTLILILIKNLDQFRPIQTNRNRILMRSLRSISAGGRNQF